MQTILRLNAPLASGAGSLRTQPMWCASFTAWWPMITRAKNTGMMFSPKSSAGRRRMKKALIRVIFLLIDRGLFEFEYCPYFQRCPLKHRISSMMFAPILKPSMKESELIIALISSCALMKSKNNLFSIPSSNSDNFFSALSITAVAFAY